LRQPDGSLIWHVWAPLCPQVSLVTFAAGVREEIAMTALGRGYFTHRQAGAPDGLRYALKLPDGRDYPDPASRWQPDGVHLPSAVFSPGAFRWSDQGWRGVAREDLVIYELHVGTFTPEGTLDAAARRLPELASLGVTAVELMPVAQFAGGRNWGYDAVYPYAVQNSYGGPAALQRLIDAAHGIGLAVFLDVIYNHFGPEGCYLAKFGPYFTDRYRTPWGMAINYDGPESDAVRQFVIDNACAWVWDFHADGLRLDAVHAIYDFSPRHILADIARAVAPLATASGRLVHVIAESSQNDVRLVEPHGRGGYGLDGVWSDDFHHAVHALLTSEGDGYYQDFGRPEQVAKALSEVFVYDGCYSPFRRRCHGTRIGAADRTRFVVCVQNHDQVGNRAAGDRLSTLVSPAANRLAAGLLLLAPCVPLLFMGEEYGEQRPFPFFTSFDDPAIIQAVRRGRREEFAALMFQWKIEVPDPQAPETFLAAKLAWAWPDGTPQAQRRQLYADLLAARRRWPALGYRSPATARLWPPAGKSRLLALQRGGAGGILAIANLTAEPASLGGADIVVHPEDPHVPGREECLARQPNLELAKRVLLLSTESTAYGGQRSTQSSDAILPYELLIFGPRGA
jgi:maltooligosyltrehalose trehalohydrolase